MIKEQPNKKVSFILVMSPCLSTIGMSLLSYYAKNTDKDWKKSKCKRSRML